MVLTLHTTRNLENQCWIARRVLWVNTKECVPLNGRHVLTPGQDNSLQSLGPTLSSLLPVEGVS